MGLLSFSESSLPEEASRLYLLGCHAQAQNMIEILKQFTMVAFLGDSYLWGIIYDSSNLHVSNMNNMSIDSILISLLKLQVQLDNEIKKYHLV